MSEDDTFKKAMLREQFLSLNTPRDVADLVGITYSTLVYHVYKTPKHERYTTIVIPKKSGGTRTLYAPVSPLKLIQRTLHTVLTSVYSPKPVNHGFMQGKSIVTNAKFHIGSRWILTVDIEDFFPSINFGRVRGLFIKPPYNRPTSVATILAQICCFDNALPQGAPSSPMISNMICGRLDGNLHYLAKSLGCRYSRYADDLTFSTNRSKLPPALAMITNSDAGAIVDVGEPLRNIIESNGFRVNRKKVRLQRFSQRQKVTGITVNEFPNVSRDLIRQIRAILHNCKTKGIENAEKDFHARFLSKHRKPDRPAPPLRRVLKRKDRVCRNGSRKEGFRIRQFSKTVEEPRRQPRKRGSTNRLSRVHSESSLGARV